MVTRSRLINRHLPAILLFVLCLLPCCSDRHRVLSQLDRLHEWSSSTVGNPGMGEVRKLHQAESLFCDRNDMHIPELAFTGTYSRSEIVSFLLRYHQMVSSVTVRFYDIHIEALDSSAASVALTARVTGVSAGGESFDEIREIELKLSRHPRKWLINSCRTVPILQR